MVWVVFAGSFRGIFADTNGKNRQLSWLKKRRGLGYDLVGSHDMREGSDRDERKRDVKLRGTVDGMGGGASLLTLMPWSIGRRSSEERKGRFEKKVRGDRVQRVRGYAALDLNRVLGPKKEKTQVQSYMF